MFGGVGSSAASNGAHEQNATYTNSETNTNTGRTKAAQGAGELAQEVVLHQADVYGDSTIVAGESFHIITTNPISLREIY